MFSPRSKGQGPTLLASIVIVFCVIFLGGLTCWWFRCRTRPDKESDYRSHSSSSANYYEADSAAAYHQPSDAILRQQLTGRQQKRQDAGHRYRQALAGSSVLPMADFTEAIPWTVSGLVDAGAAAPDVALRVIWDDVEPSRSHYETGKSRQGSLNRSSSLGSRSNDDGGSDALGAVTVTSFGPSESIDTELW